MQEIGTTLAGTVVRVLREQDENKKSLGKQFGEERRESISGDQPEVRVVAYKENPEQKVGVVLIAIPASTTLTFSLNFTGICSEG